MFKNYFKIAIRTIQRYKLFSIINILGLSVGISAALIIFLLIAFDFSFDKQHKDLNRIYRVVTEGGTDANNMYLNSGVTTPLHRAIDNIAGIASSVPLIINNYDVKVSESLYSKKYLANYKNDAHIVFTTPAYFSFFDYPVLAGNASNALKERNTVVISDARAKQYFPSRQYNEIIGKQLVYSDSILVTVGAIIGQLKGNTDLHFQEFISMKTISESNLKQNWNWDQWGSVSSDVQLIIKIKPNTDRVQIEQQLTKLYREKNDADAQNSFSKLHVQAFDDIHFNLEYGAFDSRVANKSILYTLSMVAILLILLACINFINLSTAQSLVRAKEIGIRKCIGAYKKQLITQFLMETFVITFLAIALSFVLAPLFLKLLDNFIPDEITSEMIYTPTIFVFAFLLAIVITILSGLYPAYVITKFQAIKTIKGQFSDSGKSKHYFRQGLTVLQFTVAQFFIIATLIVSKQIGFSINKDLGFRKDGIVSCYIPRSKSGEDGRTALLQKVKGIPGIKYAALGSAPPCHANTNTSGMLYQAPDGRNTEIDVEHKYGDSTYFKIYELKLVAGRFMRNADTVNEYVINTTFMQKLGIKDPKDAIGVLLDRGMSKYKIPIVGVVSDFHTKSTRATIKPLLFTNNKSAMNLLHFSFEGNDPQQWKSTITQIQPIWGNLFLNDPFDYKFFDETIAEFYQNEKNMMNLLVYASGLAIFISCMGLFGLVLFSVNQRRKEIGVRKVLGASVLQIVNMISKNALKLVLIALAIAVPIVWYSMHIWLQNFAYRIDMPWWAFLLGGLAVAGVAFATTAYHAIKAAMANPTKSLRTE
jgi:putative ABC transport system permease protein